MPSLNMLRATLRAAIDDLDHAEMLEREQSRDGSKNYIDIIAKHYKRSEDLLRDAWSELERYTLEHTKLKDY